MIGGAREAMATQQIHQWLNAVWAVVAEANRYFAGEAPWALAKTDPARQKTVLYVTAEVVRQIAILTQPVMPEAVGKLLDSLGIPAGRARLCRARRRTRIAPGTTLPAPVGGVPALRRTEGGLSRLQAMLVDSHCHLDFPDFAERSRRASSRAPQTAGIGRIVTISTRVRRLDELLAIAERFPQRLLLGRHPSAPRRRGRRHFGRRTDRADQASEGRGARRGRARLFLRARFARGAGARLSRAYRRRPRNRPAAGDPHPRRGRRLRPHPRGRDGEGTVPRRAALLHRRARAGDEGDRSRPVDLVHGHPDLQEVGSPARHSPPSCRPIASWSRPTRPISRRENSAASATSRPTWSRSPRCWRRRAASRSRRSRGRPRRTSSGCSPRCRAPKAAA